LKNEFSQSIDINSEVELNATINKSGVFNFHLAWISVFKTIFKELVTSKNLK